MYYVDEKMDKDIEKHINKAFYYSFYPKKWEGNNWRIRLYKDTIELCNLYRLHRKIASDIKSKKYDYIFVHPSKFTQAPFLLRLLKSCIYYCQEPLRIIYDSSISSNIKDISFPKNLYEFINRRLRKWIDSESLRNASIILANSNYSKELIYKSYGRKAAVCYLGVDVNLFKPQNLKKTIDVLFIGNKDNGYNLLNKLPEIPANKINIRAIFREDGKLSVSDTELVEIYNKSKVLVALNHNEPFGLISLEAMACGIPVIAVGEGGYNESIINNKTGFLISRNPHQLYAKINLIVNNEKLRNEMGKNDRENILKNWTWDKSVNRFLKIIKYEKYKD